MLCFLCGKKIGFLRRMVDQQYCSSSHRKEAKLASAEAFREEDDLEHWSVARSKEKKKGAARPQASASQTASIFAFLTVGGLLVAAMLLPGPGPGAAFPPVSLDPGVKRGMFQRVGDSLSETIRSRAPITLQHDFSSGWANWTPVHLGGRVDDPRGWTSAAAPNVG